MGAGLGPMVCPTAGKRWSHLQDQVQHIRVPGKGYRAVPNTYFRSQGWLYLKSTKTPFSPSFNQNEKEVEVSLQKVSHQSQEVLGIIAIFHLFLATATKCVFQTGTMSHLLLCASCLSFAKEATALSQKVYVEPFFPLECLTPGICVKELQI